MIKKIILVLFILPLLVGCTKIHRNNYFYEFQVKNQEIIDAKINKNPKIIEIYTNKGVSYWNKEGKCLFDTNENKDIENVNNLIFGRSVALSCNINQKYFHYFYLNDLSERHIKSFYRKSSLKDYMYFGGDNFLIMLDNNKVCRYYFNDHKVKYKRINELENYLCLNLPINNEFYFITKNQMFYKGNIDKQFTKKLYKIDNDFSNIVIKPLGKESFVLVNINGLYCYNSKGLFYEDKFYNANIDSKNIITSKNGKYVIYESQTIYNKDNKSVTETCSTLYSIKEQKKLWSKGSLFKPLECYAVSNSGYVYIKEENKIVKYSKEFMPVSEFVFDGNIIKCLSGENCIFVVTDKNHVYVINLYKI